LNGAQNFIEAVREAPRRSLDARSKTVAFVDGRVLQGAGRTSRWPRSAARCGGGSIFGGGRHIRQHDTYL